MVVVGSRASPRSVTESMAPIDAIPFEELASQGETDVGDQLRAIVPSYNVNPQPVGDAARIIRPANLRGLAPDHTLVLVNGKRRHRGAVITWIGNGVSDGAQGADISTIPAPSLPPGGGGPGGGRRPPPPLRCGGWRCCGTVPPRSTAPTPLPAC